MEVRGDKVIIRLKDDTHFDGFLITNKRKLIKPTRGEVVFKGTEVTEVEIGDTVIFEKHLPLEWDEGLHIIKEEYIKAIIKWKK